MALAAKRAGPDWICTVVARRRRWRYGGDMDSSPASFVSVRARPPREGDVVATDSHFELIDLGDNIIYGRTFDEWDNDDVARLSGALEALMERPAQLGFIMDLREMESITLSARYQTATFMKGNRGRIRATAVVVKDAKHRFTLQTLLRISGRKNVKAVLSSEEGLDHLRQMFGA